MMIRVVVHSILISIKYLLMVGGRFRRGVTCPARASRHRLTKLSFVSDETARPSPTVCDPGQDL